MRLQYHEHEQVGEQMGFAQRVLAGLVTMVTVALGLSLAVAGPAAADTGTWKPYGNTNPITSSPSTWSCSSTKTLAPNVGAQVCVIRSPSGVSVQGAIIVRNNRSSLFETDASVRLTGYPSGDALGVWDCPRSGVAKNSWSVCYGDTLVHQGDRAFAKGYANDVYLGSTRNI